jgi:hypothetical protein
MKISRWKMINLPWLLTILTKTWRILKWYRSRNSITLIFLQVSWLNRMFRLPRLIDHLMDYLRISSEFQWQTSLRNFHRYWIRSLSLWRKIRKLLNIWFLESCAQRRPNTFMSTGMSTF